MSFGKSIIITTHTMAHMMRQEKNSAHNIIQNLSEKNDFWVADKDLSVKKNRDALLTSFEKRYKEAIGQKMNAKGKEKIFLETDITLKNDGQGVDDIHKVFDEINNKLSKKGRGAKITPLQIAIHRDEGHFIDKNGVDFYPGVDVFEGRGENKGKWFLDNERKNETNISRLEFINNYHAHVVYTKFDLEQGRNARFDQKRDLQMLHKSVDKIIGTKSKTNAEYLALEPGGKTAWLSTKALRAKYATARKGKIKTLGLDPSNYKPNDQAIDVIGDVFEFKDTVQPFSDNSQFFDDFSKNINKSLDPLSDEKITDQSLIDLNRIKPLLIKKLLNHRDTEKRALFMAGSPGAGKTEVAKTLSEQFNLNHIDPDKIKTMLPNYSGDKSHLFQRASSRGVDHAFARATKDGIGVIMDGTFANYNVQKKNIEMAVDRGYRPEIKFVYRNKETSWHHVQNRKVDNNRVVPRDVFDVKHRDSLNVALQIKEEFGDKVSLNLMDLDEATSLNEKTSIFKIKAEIEEQKKEQELKKKQAKSRQNRPRVR